MAEFRGMTLTKRGEKVLAIWENLKMIGQLLIFVLIMGIMGGIECGTIPFP